MPVTTKFELKPGPATREAFGRALAELGRENKDVVVCDADLSKSTMTTYFAKEFPERFFSCGNRRSQYGGDRMRPGICRQDSVCLQLFGVRDEQGIRAAPRLRR